MAFYYTVAPSLDLIYIGARGDLLPHELRKCVKGYLQDPNFHSGIDILLEAHGDTNVRFNDQNSFDELLHLVKKARTGSSYRVACATEDRELCETFFAIVEELPTQVEVQTFGTAAEALKWLKADFHEQQEAVVDELLEGFRARAFPEIETASLKT